MFSPKKTTLAVFFEDEDGEENFAFVPAADYHLR